MNSSLELCEAIGQLGYKKILIVTDEVLVKIGLLDKIKARLKKEGVEFVIYDGILPDPTYDQVHTGLEILRNNHCEAVLAVGGGSPIDASKAIAAKATNDKPLVKMAGLFKLRKAPLPFFANSNNSQGQDQKLLSLLLFLTRSLTRRHLLLTLSSFQ